MSKTLFEMAVDFFENLKESPEALNDLKKFNAKIQFELVDDESFFADIKEGALAVKKGLAPTNEGRVVHFITNKDTVTGLFRGRVKYTEAYHTEREQRPGYEKGKLHVKETPGVPAGIPGGQLIWWVGKLVRMAQELR